ncbi:MAG: helix-turn-helix transcriptional regulator [Thermoleophilia bacterium]|jgi:MerR family transcriptional regulator/heat shock protein HspR
MDDVKNRQGTAALFMISVAADLAGMHPQTLRIYEQKGLISPARTPKNTRLYSEQDIKRLRYIQRLTTELGMNLAGVEKVIELEQNIEDLHSRIAGLHEEMERVTRQLHEEVEAVHKSYRRELVPLPKTEIMIRQQKRRR